MRRDRARAGRIPGGLAYGYEVVPPAPGAQDRGERRIKPDEAEVVRRIFKAYAAGKSPRHIAHELNAAGIPGPGGRDWGDTTLRGQLERGTGILNNTLYIGRLCWNRVSYVKDPSTGKRVARVNALDQREETEVLELRIVDQALWDACQARRQEMRFAIGQAEDGQKLNVAHRRRFLLSGLLRCGCCGAGYTIVAADRYGCAQHRTKNTCPNGTTIKRQRIEQRVLSALKDRMLAPELVAEFIKAFAEEMATAQSEAVRTQGQVHRELADIDRKLEGVLKAIEDGVWSEALKARLKGLEARKAELAAKIKLVEALPTPAVRLHPNAADIYSAKVTNLEQTLNDPELRTEAAEALAGLIDHVTLTPDLTDQDGLRAELTGDLARILLLAQGEMPIPAGSGASGSRQAKPQLARASGGVLSMVAGACIDRQLTLRAVAC